MDQNPPPNIKFTKMHGLGNDFIVVNALDQVFSPEKMIPFSDRQLGIGFDQLLVIDKSNRADFSSRFFNADGSEAEQCGNGARCIARFLHENNFLKNNHLKLETKAGILDITIHDYEKICVTMGAPEFFSSPLENFLTLSMGNPHAISRVHSVKNFPVTEKGKEIATHSVFPEGINVGFMEIVNRNKIRLRTYERGVGETCACGSNACAAVVTGINNNWLENKVTVELEHGNLLIEWEGDKHPVLMTGPAEKVFEGSLAI